MQGKIDRRGICNLTWDTFFETLLSPDGTQKILPCENCGRPSWVALNVVSTVCEPCYGVILAEEVLCE